jgi:hypothetical protein
MKSFVSVSRYSELWKPVYFPMQKVEKKLIANIHAAFKDCHLSSDSPATQSVLIPPEVAP